MRCFNRALRIARLTLKNAISAVKTPIWPYPPRLNCGELDPYQCSETTTASKVVGASDLSTWRLSMLALFARWGHNVLITTMALLTIALVASLIR